MALPPIASATDYAALIGAAPAGVNLDRLLAAASAEIRRYCGWHVTPVVVGDTLTVDGSGGRDLMLPTLRLTEVTSVTEAGTAVDLTTIEWTAAGWLRKPCGNWTTRLRGVVATVTHGFEDADDVVRLACTMASRALTPAGVVREQALTQSVEYRVDLLDGEKQTLALLRLPGRA